MDDSKSECYYSETDHLGAGEATQSCPMAWTVSVGRVCVDSLASTFRIMERRRLLRVIPPGYRNLDGLVLYSRSRFAVDSYVPTMISCLRSSIGQFGQGQ